MKNSNRHLMLTIVESYKFDKVLLFGLINKKIKKYTILDLSNKNVEKILSIIQVIQNLGLY